jgi:ATP-dependent DNA helicase PIF1
MSVYEEDSAPTHLGALTVPPAYEEARQALERGAQLIFVSGNAGTGKTTLIHYLQRVVPRQSVVLAPTGVAALNAGGVTVHSFFHFPPRIQDLSEIRVGAEKALLLKLDLLIIDEISMLRADLVDSIDVALRKARGLDEPFGGVQLLLLGDLFQLPPVVQRDESVVLQARGYSSPFFFEAHSLRELDWVHVELTEVFRQTDPDFVDLLSRIRVGEGSADAVDVLNSHCLRESGDHEITLATTNRIADSINGLAMDSLTAPEFVYKGEMEGDFGRDANRLPSPAELRLRVGAHVMFTRNDDAKRWVNGSLAVIHDLSPASVIVKMLDGNIHKVEPVTWQTFKYGLDESGDKIVATAAGEYTQYPLMLAWAVTIHKSQGKTLGKALVDLGAGTFSSGQAYVALSRCRSMDDVRLARPLRASDIRCDPRVRRFYEELAAGRWYSPGFVED